MGQVVVVPLDQRVRPVSNAPIEYIDWEAILDDEGMPQYLPTDLIPMSDYHQSIITDMDWYPSFSSQPDKAEMTAWKKIKKWVDPWWVDLLHLHYTEGIIQRNLAVYYGMSQPSLREHIISGRASAQALAEISDYLPPTHQRFLEQVAMILETSTSSREVEVFDFYLCQHLSYREIRERMGFSSTAQVRKVLRSTNETWINLMLDATTSNGRDARRQHDSRYPSRKQIKMLKDLSYREYREYREHI